MKVIYFDGFNIPAKFRLANDRKEKSNPLKS